MIRLLIADDHLIFRQCLRRLLADEADLTIAAEAAGYSEALSAARKCRIDVAIIDLSMPGRDGLELIAQLKVLKPHIHTLALTMHTEEHCVMRALRAGADGYLTKSSAGDDLISAIHKVAAGDKFVSPALAERLTLAVAAGEFDENAHNGLTGREFKVLEMVVAGKRGSEIAKELSLSEKTISTHKTNLLRKLNLQNGTELVRYAIHKGLISVDGA